VPSLGELV